MKLESKSDVFGLYMRAQDMGSGSQVWSWSIQKSGVIVFSGCSVSGYTEGTTISIDSWRTWFDASGIYSCDNHKMTNRMWWRRIVLHFGDHLLLTLGNDPSSGAIGSGFRNMVKSASAGAPLTTLDIYGATKVSEATLARWRNLRIVSLLSLAKLINRVRLMIWDSESLAWDAKRFDHSILADWTRYVPRNLYLWGLLPRPSFSLKVM